MKKNLKKIAFWTAVLFVPGGIVLAAYRLGREHRKIKKVVNRLLKKEEKND